MEICKMINMKDLIKKQGNMIRKQSGMNIKEEKLTEASSSEYIKAYNKMYKSYENFAREVMNLAKTSSKLDGDKVDEKIILKNFKKDVIPFISLMKGWLKGKIK